MNALRPAGTALRAARRGLLVALLAILYLVLLAGTHSSLGVILWVAHVGLFFLWQPFVEPDARLGFRELILLAAIIGGGIWLFGWWLLIIWSAALAALVGGRVMFVEHRPTRLFYLLAFAYLLVALVVWLVPKVVPDVMQAEPSLEPAFFWGAPLLLVSMLLMPAELHGTQGATRSEGANPGVVDFFYSLFIFLLIAVLVLGTLAFMLLRQTGYFESVFKTLILLAAVLFLIAWAWNPRPGFSGMSVFFSRYLLTLGLPFEQWLHRLAVHSASQSDPERFLAQAVEDLRRLPWVVGGCWMAGAQQGRFGEEARHAQKFAASTVSLTLFTLHPLSPALAWHFELLVGLVDEYYLAKRRERELQQMSYLRAVYETGSRLTHDVKNLLQSLNNLCYLAQSMQVEPTSSFDSVFQQQLAQIARRLQQTMKKLQKPQADVGETESAVRWWGVLQERYAADAVVFDAPVPDALATLPASLFDSVVDNLLQNALAKRQVETGLTIRVALARDASCLCVCDDGSPLGVGLVDELLRAPVVSENGLGIGLYHAARQAESAGYRLTLACNRAGSVCFELKADVDMQATRKA